jgi:hypothetical protein
MKRVISTVKISKLLSFEGSKINNMPRIKTIVKITDIINDILPKILVLALAKLNSFMSLNVYLT